MRGMPPFRLSSIDSLGLIPRFSLAGVSIVARFVETGATVPSFAAILEGL